MTDQPRRPWWKRKRWRLFALFWLTFPILYPLSAGPAYYCHGRGWIGLANLHLLYAPASVVLEMLPRPLQQRWDAYTFAALRSGLDHRQAASG